MPSCSAATEPVTLVLWPTYPVDGTVRSGTAPVQVPSLFFFSTSMIARSLASEDPPDSVRGRAVRAGVGSETVLGDAALVEQVKLVPATRPMSPGRAGFPM